METEFYGFIYITTNLINNKKYIGMHNNFSDDYLGSGTLLTKAVKKYGKENFSREIIAYAKTKEELAELEKEFIKKYNAVNKNDFYNIHTGGFGGNTIAGFTEEQLNEYKLKMRKSLLECKNPPYGKPLTEDIKNKIRDKQLIYWSNISDEDREKFKQTMSNTVKGNKNPNFGNYWSEEKKQQLSELRIKNGKSKGELNGMFGKKGDNAINGKKIYMYDENFNLIQIFNTVGLALEFLNLKGHIQLNNAIKNKTLYKGFYWSKNLY